MQQCRCGFTKGSPHSHALFSLVGRLLVSLPFGPGHLGYDRRHGEGVAEVEGAGVRAWEGEGAGEGAWTVDGERTGRRDKE